MTEISKTFSNYTVDDIRKTNKSTPIKYTKRLYKVGIIRQPLANWISTFNFWFKDRPYGYFNNSISCYGQPYLKLISTFKNYPDKKNYRLQRKSLPTFLKYRATALYALPDVDISRKIKSSFWGFRAMNYMSHNFGLPFDEYVTDEAIRQKVAEFDLIIVLERSLESLLMLKHLLCMNFQDLIIDESLCDRCKEFTATADLSKNVEFSMMSEVLRENMISREQAELIKSKFLFNDIRLYNEIGRKFKKDLEKFGLEKMKSEILEYEKFQANFKANISSSTSPKPAYTDSQYSKYLRPKVKISEKPENFDENLVNYMITEGGGYCSFYQEFFREFDLNVETNDQDDDYHPWWKEFEASS